MLVITEDDPIYVVEFFRVFFAEYPRERITLVGITVDRAFHEPLARTLGRMLRFYGPVGTFRQGLRFVGAKLSGRSIEAIANEHGVPVLSTPSVNAPEYLERIRALGPEVDPLGRRTGDLLARAARHRPARLHQHPLRPAADLSRDAAELLADAPRRAGGHHHRASDGRAARRRRRAGDARLSDPATRHARPRHPWNQARRVRASSSTCWIRSVSGTASAMPVDMGEASYFRFPTPDDVRAFRRRGHRLL